MSDTVEVSQAHRGSGTKTAVSASRAEPRSSWWSRTRQRLDAFPTQAVLAVLWALLVIPSLLFWSESILWVIFISLYANVATHFGAHVAWRAKRAAETKAAAVDAEPSGQLPSALERVEAKLDALVDQDAPLTLSR